MLVSQSIGESVTAVLRPIAATEVNPKLEIQFLNTVNTNATTFLFQHLFPDAFESEEAPPTEQEQSQGNKSSEASLVQKLKSAPQDSLTALLAKALCIINSNHGNMLNVV